LPSAVQSLLQHVRLQRGPGLRLRRLVCQKQSRGQRTHTPLRPPVKRAKISVEASGRPPEASLFLGGGIGVSPVLTNVLTDRPEAYPTEKRKTPAARVHRSPP